jgi:hypothetical protein
MASGKILKDNWRGRGFMKPIADWMNKVAFILNTARGFNGVDVCLSAKGLRIDGGASSGLDLSEIYGGYTSINQTTRKVSMNRTYVNHQGHWFRVPAADIDISGTTSIVTVKYIRGHSAEYMNPAPATLMSDSNDAIYAPLIVFKNARRFMICHLGVITIRPEHY